MLPAVKVGALCWQQIEGELWRVYPNEGILVPLVSLQPRDPERNPCATIRMADIESVVISDVVLVPREMQRNNAARVSVGATTDDVVGARVEALSARFPRLRACAYLHSHPFARGSTWPSRGPRCDYEGHMLPLLASNREAGLDASFSFIACRDRRGRGWKLQCFALDDEREIVNLGFAEVIDDLSPTLADAHAPPLKSCPRARGMLRHFRRELRRRRLRFTCDELFDGWQRAVVRFGSGAAVLLVPIDFPRAAPQLYVVDPGRRTHRVRLGDAGATSVSGWLSVIDLAARSEEGSKEECHAA